MIKSIRAALATIVVAMGLSAGHTSVASAFMPVGKDAFALAETGVVHVSCGGVDCDVYSKPRRKVYRRYDGFSRKYRSRRSYKRSRSVRRWNSYRRAAAACRELGLELRRGRCRATRWQDRARKFITKHIACPRGMYRNPLGRCQSNQTGG